ncbi:MAG: thiamine-phosphate kinase [Rubrobacteraceae bacterium]|nr:thiamine-phosphate kinase [Rubrobacter sp.]
MDEFDVIQSLSKMLPSPPPEVLVPIGDDCAVLRLGGTEWVAAADMLVSGHHFEGWATPEDVGYKAVAVNVSDVAAMGGTPRFVLVSGGAPDPETALRCMRGVIKACDELGVYPLGGDTTRADSLTVDVSILGELSAPPLLRSGARPGDLLAVTGELGASAAGLLALQGGERVPERLVRKHLRPEPRVETGLAAARLGVHAAIDLSDGLASDVRRICERSGVGCNIGLERLPVADDTRRLAGKMGHDPQKLAATGGEDYELLLAAPERTLEALGEESGVPITVVGEVTAEGVVFLRGGRLVDDLSGWDHFSDPASEGTRGPSSERWKE